MNINKRNHLETLFGSLGKMFLNAKQKGIIRNKELYLLNIIFKIIKYDCFLDNKNSEKKALLSLYFKILNKYKFLCKSELTREYYYETKNLNQNHTPTPQDCYVIPESNLIYYWQEESFETTYQDIVPLVNQEYLDSKNNDTYSNFENGKNINYTNIGRICFADNKNIEYANYEITDVLGNDMSNFFTLTTIPSQTCALIVSKNIYSFGEVFIKIKKTNNNSPIIVQGIFEEQFENQFE